MKEDSIIETLKRLCPSNESVILGIDDDAAILRPTTRETLVCTDMLMEGVHFRVEGAGAAAVGYKALAVNLSDIAAMGGRAMSAYVSLALPRTKASAGFIEDLYRGMKSLADRFHVAIAGGDSNIWDGPFVINVTVLGEAHPKGPVLRGTAKAGDTIFVTGPLGGSIDSHHLNFVPRLSEVKALMDAFDLTSLMDLSDGLGKDLREIARRSDLAAFLDREAIPLRPGIALHPHRLQKALSDGEDFELCFTLGEQDAARLSCDSGFAYCRAIGTMREGSGLYWSDDESPIPWGGFEHGGDSA